jgi:hypothetical protein
MIVAPPESRKRGNQEVTENMRKAERKLQEERLKEGVRQSDRQSERERERWMQTKHQGERNQANGKERKR